MPKLAVSALQTLDHARRTLTPALAFVAVLVFGALASDVALAQAESRENWVTVNKDYSSQRYVDLDQFTPENVGRVKQVCEINLNQPAWFNSGLLMIGRTLYVTTLYSTFAIDAATCDLRWRHEIEFTRPPATNSNRGPGYLDGTIFRGTGDGRVIALDAASGNVLWQVQAANPTRRESFLSAPIAWDGKVFIGIGISDLDVQGRMMAFDAKTGRELWRFHTVPVGIEPGANTWGRAPPAGGGFWTSYSLDPATGEVFAPVANPFPDFGPAARKGDNLYTNSVVSLDARTGKLNWFHQTVPYDDHDWDQGAPPTLYRSASGRNLLAVAGKDGYVVGIDRATKQVVFKTPVTTIANAGRLDESLQRVCPGVIGGTQWSPPAYHPGLKTIYAGANDWCAWWSSKNYSADPGFWSGESEEGGNPRMDFSTRASGWITALDGETGKPIWKFHADAQVLAGLTPTKSGLLFGGDVLGNLLMLDAKSGALLRKIDTKGALNNGLISYAVDGNQYVAAAAGGVTLNANSVAGPLRVVVYGLNGSDPPKVVKLERGRATPIPATGDAANAMLFGYVCGSCHGGTSAVGSLAPPLTRQTQMGDPEVLKAFLKSVPPPMPVLYPGLLEDNDVEMIAAHLKTLATKQNAKLTTDTQVPTAAYKVPPPSTGSREWQAMYAVISSARCMNCHAGTYYPRQTDLRYPHVYSVVRGADDKGAPVARCDACHGSTNNAATGVPGAPSWHAAPLSMTTESAPNVAKSGSEMCEALRDRTRNGNRDPVELLHHVSTDPLIIWTWSPGTRWNGETRATPPGTHQDFVNAFAGWVQAGAPCPAQ